MVNRIALNRIAALWHTLRRHGAPVAGLTLLLIVGSLVLLAAPGGSATPHSSQAALFAAPSSTATASASHTASPTLRQQAPQATTPTATPTTPPTATPTTQPPTPTPAPSWHTIGTYSGSTSQPLVTISPVQGPIRFDWTCSITPPSPASWALYYAVQVNGQSSGGGVTDCVAGNTSGSVTRQDPLGSSVAYSIYADTAGGAWTVTIEELY